MSQAPVSAAFDVHILDAQSVPALFSGRALSLLGAVRDFEQSTLTLRALGGLQVPLTRSAGGHFLLCLTDLLRTERVRTADAAVEELGNGSQPEKGDHALSRITIRRRRTLSAV